MPTPAGTNPLAYEGVLASNPANVINALRAPTTADLNYLIGTIWINTVSSTAYYLVKNQAGSATWVNSAVGNGSFTTVTTTGAISGGSTITATTALVAGTTVTAGTGITSTTGNITSTAGDFVASAAGKGVVLGGGAKVVCGTGSPSTVVTAPQGSLYLRLDGSSVSTRAYINTDGATAWTAITTAA